MQKNKKRKRCALGVIDALFYYSHADTKNDGKCSYFTRACHIINQQYNIFCQALWIKFIKSKQNANRLNYKF